MVDLEDFIISEFILWSVFGLIDNISFISFKKTESHVCNKLVIINIMNIGKMIT